MSAMTRPGSPSRRGDAPLLVSLPHTGTDLAEHRGRGCVSPWLARRDSDWWIDRLYDFAADLGATVVHTAISRTVIDVNRDPSGASLYPGQATTGLCPTETFDGEPLYRAGRGAGRRRDRRGGARPISSPITRRWQAEIARLRDRAPDVVLYDCHSIRSVVAAPVRRQAAGVQPRHQ